MSLRRIISALAAAAALIALLPATGAADSRCWDYKWQERDMARKINNARDNHGKVRLSLDPELSKVARKHTSEMVQRTNIFHQSNRQLNRRVTNWYMLGENVGAGGTVDSLHSAFMNSSGHRYNIMKSEFRHVGIGTKRFGGRLWITVLFESRLDPGTRLKMPRCR